MDPSPSPVSLKYQRPEYKDKTIVNYAISEKEVGCDNVDKPDKGDRGGRVTRLTGFTERWAALHCTWIIWTVLGYFRL